MDLVVRIGEMIMFQAYNIQSPLDGEAAMWADLNQHRLPIDRRDLLAGGEAGLPGRRGLPETAPEAVAKHSGISVERRRPAPLPPAAASVPLPARAPTPAREQPQAIPEAVLGEAGGVQVRAIGGVSDNHANLGQGGLQGMFLLP